VKSLRHAFVIAASALLCGEALAASSSSWLLGYGGKSTNALITDKRAATLIHKGLPAELADKVEGALGGPPELVRVSAQRYVSMSACFPHACNVKGFLWVDAQTGLVLGADADCSFGGEGKAWPCVITLGSMGLSREAIPEAAVQGLRAWMRNQKLEPVSVAFIGADGVRAQLDLAGYVPWV
jgi:hypothetical protein